MNLSLSIKTHTSLRTCVRDWDARVTTSLGLHLRQTLLCSSAFNEARGYPMERENYLKDLKTKTPKV